MTDHDNDPLEELDWQVDRDFSVLPAMWQALRNIPDWWDRWAEQLADDEHLIWHPPNDGGWIMITDARDELILLIHYDSFLEGSTMARILIPGYNAELVLKLDEGGSA